MVCKGSDESTNDGGAPKSESQENLSPLQMRELEDKDKKIQKIITPGKHLYVTAHHKQLLWNHIRISKCWIFFFFFNQPTNEHCFTDAFIVPDSLSGSV